MSDNTIFYILLRHTFKSVLLKRGVWEFNLMSPCICENVFIPPFCLMIVQQEEGLFKFFFS